MKSVTLVALASGLFTMVSAQNYPVITADDVIPSIREVWCQQQLGICPNLCQDQAHVDPEFNNCYPDDLSYECVCLDGSRPNLTEYSLTIPYNLCQQSKQACADNCGNNQACVTSCFTVKECGASSPRRVNITTTTSTATKTGGGSSSGTGGADSTTTETSTDTADPFNNAGVSLSLNTLGSAYGVGAMIAGMAIGFFGML